MIAPREGVSAQGRLCMIGGGWDIRVGATGGYASGGDGEGECMRDNCGMIKRARGAYRATARPRDRARRRRRVKRKEERKWKKQEREREEADTQRRWRGRKSA